MREEVTGLKNLQLLWVARSHLACGDVIRAHSHDYYHLLCVCSGQLQFTLGDTTAPLPAGDLVIVPKGAIHHFENQSPDTAHYYEVKFTVPGSALGRTVQLCEGFVRSDPFAARLVEHIANEYLCCRTQKDSSAAAALSTLIFHLTADQRLIDEGEPEIIDTTGYSDLARSVIDYLCAHYSQSVTLDDVSAGVGITKNYLCNAFKRNTGITILECLNLIRIRKAAELIVYSDLSLAQVAQLCGYVSVSHFNRVFAHYIGLPPGQCRRAYSADLVVKTQPNPDSFIYSVLAGKGISPTAIEKAQTAPAGPNL